MSAATAAIQVPTKDGIIKDLALLAGQTIYKGTPVFTDAASGYAQTPDGVTITQATGDVWQGICDETITNSGSSGDKRVKVRTSGLFQVPITGTVTVAKIGAPIYINNTSDNATFTLTAAGDGSDCIVGYLADVISTTVGLMLIAGCGRFKVGYNPDPSASGTFGTGNVLVARMTYDFSVDGGAVGTITPATTCIIPSGSIVLQAITNVITACTTGSTTTVAVQLQSANDIHTAASVAGAPWSTTGLKAGTPVHTAATSIILTADRTAQVVIGTAALTAGKFTTYFFYVPA